jgi:nicotinate-nucleotide--dimethylbenzimidazole phosphoribosyltransferase
VSPADQHGGDYPVCSVAEAAAGLAAGVAVADEEIDAGADLLVVTHVGTAAGVAAAALVVLLADVELTASVGRLHGDRSWMQDVAAVRDATRRARPLIADRTALLAEVAGADLAAVTGLLLRAAGRRTPVVLDGAAVAACGLVAHRIAYRSAHWCLAADSGAEPAQAAAQERLSLTPLYDLAVEASGGVMGLLAVPVLRTAAGLLARP